VRGAWRAAVARRGAGAAAEQARARGRRRRACAGGAAAQRLGMDQQGDNKARV
jgi:hypothetical protein